MLKWSKKKTAERPEEKSHETLKPLENQNFRRFARGFMSGNLLRLPGVQRRLKYALVIALFMLLYIANGYYTQQLNRRYTRLNNEVKELRTRSLSLNEMRMTATRQSEIIKALREHGIELEESVVPPAMVE